MVAARERIAAFCLGDRRRQSPHPVSAMPSGPIRANRRALNRNIAGTFPDAGEPKPEVTSTRPIRNRRPGAESGEKGMRMTNIDEPAQEPSPPPDEGTPPTPPPDEGTLPSPDPVPDDPGAD